MASVFVQPEFVKPHMYGEFMDIKPSPINPPDKMAYPFKMLQMRAKIFHPHDIDPPAMSHIICCFIPPD